jgi:preprotein translocase subunit SecG
MQILNIFQVLVAIALVGLVLVQKGLGATAGASFGAGASATVFGSRGAGTFLTRATWVLAALFCTISLTMAVVVSRTVGVPDSDLGVVEQTVTEEESIDSGEAIPPGTELSVSAKDQSGNDVSAFDSGSETTSDVPLFEVPDDAGAIEGSEVRDEFQPEGQGTDETADEGGADSGR